MKRKKIYLSLPIAGHEDTVLELNEEYKEVIKENFPDWDIYSPIDENGIGEAELKDHTQLERTAFYMGKDIEAVILCDAIAMGPGWGDSKGCRVEKYTAEIYGKEVYQIYHWYDKNYYIKKRED